LFDGTLLRGLNEKEVVHWQEIPCRKAKLSNPKCMCLKWEKIIFNNHFTTLKKYTCSVPFDSNEFFLKINSD
jgi:hypothetical protein